MEGCGFTNRLEILALIIKNSEMMIPTFCLALACHIVKYEATKSAILLHQIQNKYYSRIKKIVSFLSSLIIMLYEFEESAYVVSNLCFFSFGFKIKKIHLF